MLIIYSYIITYKRIKKRKVNRQWKRSSEELFIGINKFKINMTSVFKKLEIKWRIVAEMLNR